MPHGNNSPRKARHTNQPWLLTFLALTVLAGACGLTQTATEPKENTAVKDGLSHDVNGFFNTSGPTAYGGQLVFNVAGDWTTPSQYCLDDGSLYKGATYRLGRTNVFFDGDVPKSALNAPALVYGKRVKGLDRKIVQLGPCPKNKEEPMPQFRSDWISDEADWRGHTTKARLATIEYIEATAIYPLPIVSQAEVDDPTKIALTVRNTFDRTLPATLQFSLYYEGGAGKPMPKFESLTLGELKAGESKTILAPKPQDTAKPTRPSRWLFRGYRIQGDVGNVQLNLLVTL